MDKFGGKLDCNSASSICLTVARDECCILLMHFWTTFRQRRAARASIQFAKKIPWMKDKSLYARELYCIIALANVFVNVCADFVFKIKLRTNKAFAIQPMQLNANRFQELEKML